MSNHTNRSNESVTELSPEALDEVLGGHGGSSMMMASSLHADHESRHAHHGVGYHDHFNLNFGHGPAVTAGGFAPELPGPVGLGGNTGHATTADAAATAAESNGAYLANAGSAFDLIDQLNSTHTEQVQAQAQAPAEDAVADTTYAAPEAAGSEA